MSSFDLMTFSSDDALADGVAAWLLEELEAGRTAPEPYCLALSGGRIARRFLLAVTDRARARVLPMKRVHFFWGDERCVPPTDPESNFGMACDCLLIPLGIPDAQIHRIRGEAAPEAAAAAAEAELRGIAPPGPGGQPVFDLVLLGMGEEGHVASLFPGEPQEIMASPAVFRPVNVPKPPPQRITLGYPAIGAARQVWVLATGPGKTSALGRSLDPAGDTPLARVIKGRPRTRIATDLRVFSESARFDLTGCGSHEKE
jgi:6-phosphogluconolactonase